MSKSELTQIDIKELIFSECKALEITAKKFADSAISGAYKSLKKGTGIEFEEARIYTPSDDARRIDWKVTARKQKPYIKSFREERDQNIIILVDGSLSTLLGVEYLKSRRILEIAAFIGSIASFNRDNIGSLIYTGQNFSFNKPKRGFSSVYKILNDIVSRWHKIESPNEDSFLENDFKDKQMSFSEVLFGLQKLVKRKSQVFIISDFNFPLEFESALKALSVKNDVYCLTVADSLETNLPTSGTYLVQHPESGEESIISFSNKSMRQAMISAIETHRIKLDNIFKRHRIPYLSLNEKSEVRLELFSFFKEQANSHG